MNQSDNRVSTIENICCAFSLVVVILVSAEFSIHVLLHDAVTLNKMLWLLLWLFDEFVTLLSGIISADFHFAGHLPGAINLLIIFAKGTGMC